MISLNQGKIKKTKDRLLGIFIILAEHLFLSFLFLIFISLILGFAVFYKYNILPQRIEPEIGEIIKFDEKAYQRVLEEWQNRGERFESVRTKQYPNLFK